MCLTSLLISYLNLKNLPFGSEQFFLEFLKFLILFFNQSPLSLFWSTTNLEKDFIDWIIKLLLILLYFLLPFFKVLLPGKFPHFILQTIYPIFMSALKSLDTKSCLGFQAVLECPPAIVLGMKRLCTLQSSGQRL